MSIDTLATTISEQFEADMAAIVATLETTPPDLRTEAGLNAHADTLARLASLASACSQRCRVMALLVADMRRDVEQAGLDPDPHIRLVKG